MWMLRILRSAYAHGRRCLGRTLPAVFFSLPLLLASCERPAAPPAARPPVEVTVSHPLVQTMTETLEFTGTTAPAAMVEVRARVSGFLEAVWFEPRDRVAAGQVLFEIDARPFAAERDKAAASVAALTAEFAKAESDRAKVEELFERGVTSSDELTTARTRSAALQAQIAGAEAALAEAELRLNWCRVEAPITGRISRNLLDPGNLVTADATVLATIVNDDVIYAYFDASEIDVLRLREAARTGRLTSPAEGPQPEIRALQWPVHLGVMTDTGYPHTGVLDYSAPALDPGTGTVQVRGRFDNMDGVLMAGLFVRVQVPASAPFDALLVAERALGFDQGQRFALVVNAQNIVEYRPVEVGSLRDGLRVIRAGLRPDEQVIVNGLQRVRPGVTVQPMHGPMPADPAAAPTSPVPATAPSAS